MFHVQLSIHSLGPEAEACKHGKKHRAQPSCSRLSEFAAPFSHACSLKSFLPLKPACSGQGGSKASHDASGNAHPHTADAEAQADLASAAPSGAPNPPVHPPNPPAPPNPPPPAMEGPPVHTRDVAVGSGSDGSQPKRRKRSTVTKNAQARANGGYGHYSAYAPQSGYGHHPIHGHYADYEVGPVHGKGKKQAAHRTPKQDDKGPCLNPACRTTGRAPITPDCKQLGAGCLRLCVCLCKCACVCVCPCDVSLHSTRCHTYLVKCSQIKPDFALFLPWF